MTAKKATKKATKAKKKKTAGKIAMTAAEIAKLPLVLGSKSFCSDVREVSFGLIITADAGGGDHVAPVFCDGQKWLIG